MSRPALARSLAALTVTLALAACGRETATDPAAAPSDAEVSADVAAAAGDVVVADLASFGDGEMVGGLDARAGAGAACPLSGGRFRCATTTSNNVTTTHSFAYFDAGGAPMTSYDARLTASMNLQTDVSGSAAGTTPVGTFTTTFTRSRNRTVSGLAGAETRRTWNGTGSGTSASTVSGPFGTRHYAGAASDTTRDVVVAVPRTDGSYPLSGTHVQVVSATLSVDGSSAPARAVTRRAVVTFNGTAAVPITVGATHCTLHLDTRRVDGCASN